MLIITGTLAYDHIMDFPDKFADHTLPDRIDKINLSFIVNNFNRRRGGTAGNASYSLGLLKTDHVLFSYAGKDFAEYRDTFTKLGINTGHIMIDDDNYTSTGFAMTDANSNQIWGYYYGASSKIPELKLSSLIRSSNLKKAALVLIGPSGTEGSMSFVNQCIDLNIPYVFDPGFILTMINNDDLEKGVKHAKYLIGNEYEIHLIKSRISNFSQITSRQTIITTLADKGVEIKYKGISYFIKPARPKRVLDPTGAGDAFRSGFLAGLVRDYDILTCGQMGALAAAYNVEHHGSQEHSFTLSQFEKRYRQEYHSMIKL